ncbi:MAG TPA: hypothetical protein VGF21_01010 [Thermoleophilaceae bacterium]|jgi:hypothetical protein
MKRFILLACVLGLLALPAAASAKVVELGDNAGPARSNCPNNPCEAIGRVTGYQGRSGTVANPFRIPRAGKIVAFTITLAKVTPQQVTFFNDRFGSSPSVRLTILRKGKKRKTRLSHRLIRQSKVYNVQHYLGSTPSFALDQPLVVKRGYIVAITVPTWVPAFAFTGLSSKNWWRSSRHKGDCSNATQRAAQQHVGGTRTYGCTYHKARLLYTATYVPDPRPTDKAK